MHIDTHMYRYALDACMYIYMLRVGNTICMIYN